MRGPSGDLGGVAHDLRSALSAGVAYIELAQEKLDTGQPLERADLDRVARALDKMTIAVERLQAFANAGA